VYIAAESCRREAEPGGLRGGKLARFILGAGRWLERVSTARPVIVR
jgi:hypothetical protein